jgi:uncharacterized protein YecE (DUF72 family)
MFSLAILCGTCAWADHQQFYPKWIKPTDRLAFYADYFPLVEVDSTYYGIPALHVVEEWTRQTPKHFVFDVKAYRTLTLHDRGEATESELQQDFLSFVRVLSPLQRENRLGVVLFQFPPWFVCNGLNEAYVERVVTQMDGFHLAIEFRHRSWWQGEQAEKTARWLSQLGTTNVVCDEPQTGMGTIPFVPTITNARTVMFRLHGRNKDTWYQKGLTSSQQRFDYKYSTGELSDFLPFVRTWANEATDVHILMNNNQGDYAVTNALDWLSILGLPAKERPVLTATEQLSLFDANEL